MQTIRDSFVREKEDEYAELLRGEQAKFDELRVQQHADSTKEIYEQI